MTDPLLELGVRFSRAQGKVLAQTMDSTDCWLAGTATYATETKAVYAAVFSASRGNYVYKGLRVDLWAREKVDMLLAVIRYTVEHGGGIHPVQRLALKQRAREVMQVTGCPVVDQLAWLTA